MKELKEGGNLLSRLKSITIVTCIIVVVVVTGILTIILDKTKTASNEYATVEKTYMSYSNAILSSTHYYVAAVRSEDGSKKVNLQMTQDDWELVDKGDIVPVTVYRMPKSSVERVMYGHLADTYVPILTVFGSPCYE